MSDGNNIHLTDFGSFIVRGHPAPVSMKINESKVVEFKAGKNFNKIVNQ